MGLEEIREVKAVKVD